MAAFKLSELPPQMIARIRAADRAALGLSPVGAGDDKGRQEKAVTGRTGPNKTEALYRDVFLVGMDARFEALTLRMANGHRYTPDWVVVRGGRVECHEVKGSYRLHSHQRARLAFDQARIEFPQFVFVWAVYAKREWKREIFNRVPAAVNAMPAESTQPKRKGAE